MFPLGDRMHRAAAAAAIDQAIRSTPRPVIEPLEDRRLLAAPELVDGVITWVGGPEENRFVAFAKGKTVVVRADGVTTLFKLVKVSGLSADGGEGDDRILIDQAKGKFLLRTMLAGGIGDDTIVGGGGRNAIRGGPGLDSLTGGAGKDNIAGNEDADTIDGGLGNDKITGNDGDDSILAGAGNDSLFGGPGNDTLRGDDGDDLIAGDEGDDYANGGDGDDTLAGGFGADKLYGGAGDDSLGGDDGDDRLQGDKGNDTLLGGAGGDTIYGRTSKDTGDGSGDDDSWSGNQLDNDDIYGGGDADLIFAGPGDDLVFGEAGDDQIFAGGGWDDVSGGDGNDTIDGGSGEDVIAGDAGFDFLSGGDGDDFLDGGANGDVLAGGNGNDALRGGDGNDSLLGEAGDDDLDGQLGLDSLAGGLGADRFAPSTDGDVTDRNESDPGGSGSNYAPIVGSISASADPVVVGDLLSLTANGVTDLDGSILSVRFYRETNGLFGLQTGIGGDLLIATDHGGADGWTAVVDMNGVEPGQYEYHAQAIDNALALSAPVSTIVSAEMPLNLRPAITALVASPTPVEIGANFLLTAQNVRDFDGSVKSVSFFEETNGVAGLQTGPGGDKLLGNGTRSFSNWMITVGTNNRQARDYVFYARATDNGYGFSAVASSVVGVVPPANRTPKVGGLTAGPGTLIAGATLTLTANSVSDPDGTVTQVRFYYEYNGIDGLQVGVGGDAFLAADTTPGTTWTASIPTTGWNAGEYRFYAQATDDDGETGNAVVAFATVEPYYLVDVTVDNAAATLAGAWTSAAGAAGQYGADYLHDGNALQGTKSATFASRLPQASVYEVFARWPAALTHASNARVEVIDSAGVTHSLTVNQRQRGGEWVALGTYHFSTAADAVVRFRNDAADGFVVADAVRFATSNRPPVIGEMGDFPASVKAGESLMVFAKNITDRDGKVASVSFYRESNGIAGLQTGDGGDAFLGTDTTLANNAYSVSFVVLGLAPATYTYYAQAADEEGAVGNPLSTTNVVAP